MNNTEFKELYNRALAHGWVTSKDPSVAARQKEREREYNRKYYLNKIKNKTQRKLNDISNTLERAANSPIGKRYSRMVAENAGATKEQANRYADELGYNFRREINKVRNDVDKSIDELEPQRKMFDVDAAIATKADRLGRSGKKKLQEMSDNLKKLKRDALVQYKRAKGKLTGTDGRDKTAGITASDAAARRGSSGGQKRLERLYDRRRMERLASDKNHKRESRAQERRNRKHSTTSSIAEMNARKSTSRRRASNRYNKKLEYNLRPKREM